MAQGESKSGAGRQSANSPGRVSQRFKEPSLWPHLPSPSPSPSGPLPAPPPPCPLLGSIWRAAAQVTPGPGEHSPDDKALRRSSPAFTISGRFDSKEASALDVPGPGSYEFARPRPTPTRFLAFSTLS
jgi:hypothetical protein